MFAAKNLVLLVVMCSGLAFADEFDEAVQSARKSRLTEVDTPKNGTPFYSTKTLDPIWGEASTDIVQINQLDLLNQENQRKDEKLFNNEITFVAFFFSSCRGFCPTLLRHLQEVEKKVSSLGRNVKYVAISVDPKTDSPARLKDYAKTMKFSKNWQLLTGSEEKIYALARETFAAEAFKLPKSKGQFAHSEHFYVLDRQRRLRGILNGTRMDVADKAYSLVSTF